MEEQFKIQLDDQGVYQVKTSKIEGLLKAVLFKIPEEGSFNVSIKIADSNIVLFNERDISNDYYYSLRIQDRDGFGQFFTQSNSEYLLNDYLIITVQGNPNDLITCVLRWV